MNRALTDSQSIRSASRMMNLLAIAILLLGLWLPLIGTFLPCGHFIEIRENRKLANIPAISSYQPHDLLAYVSGIRKYFRDRFGFRGALIKTRSAMMVIGLGVSPNPAVVL